MAGVVRGPSEIALDWFGAVGGLGLGECACKVERPPIHLCSSCWLMGPTLQLFILSSAEELPSSILARPRGRGRIHVLAPLG